MLRPYRVLDLTDERADLGPMIMADLGAEVVKVEPPSGCASRKAPPLAARGGDAVSLRFAAFNRSKRSVTLDLDSDEERGQFRQLVAGADFLFENSAPGAMAARGLGFDQLRQVNPGLVYVATTPFGQDGPYANHVATDLTLSAMGGLMAVTGDADRPPVRISVPQAWLHAAVESVVGGLVAHARRVSTGEAQFVDVSVQAAVFWTILNATIAAAVQGKDIERNSTLLQLGTVTLPLVYPAEDGGVVLVANGPTITPMIPWLIEDGSIDPGWAEGEDWATFDVRTLSGQPTKHSYEAVMARIAGFLARYSREELLERGLQAGVTLAPVNRIPDVMRFGHLRERRYWQPAKLAGRAVDMPGPFARATATPLRPPGAVPQPGEGNAELLGRPRKPAGATPDGRTLPFDGLKVADFSWIGVGPITAKYLADHGADVVRVETAAPPDRLRVAGPFKDGQPGLNRSQFFASFNSSKRSLALCLKHPAAVEIAKRLIAWADVCIESFTPSTMKNLGLGYDSVRDINPSVIMVSSCLMGQDGPAAPLAGYGYHAAAMAGFYEVTGWPDRPPGGPYVAYTDTIAPRFLAATLMAALDHRRRTGEGQYIEQSQMESALYFLAPELLDYQVNGTVPTRMGNRSSTAAPHGAYPCRGQDQWCAIAIEADAQWQALRVVMGDPEWACDGSLDTAAGRLAREEELDARLAEWTAAQDAYELMAGLQARGVAAGVVQRSSDLLRDPQFAHRGFYRRLEHCEMGEIPYEGHQFRIRGYDSGPRFAAPGFGEHSAEVLREVLGMGDEELAEAFASGAIA